MTRIMCHVLEWTLHQVFLCPSREGADRFGLQPGSVDEAGFVRSNSGSDDV